MYKTNCKYIKFTMAKGQCHMAACAAHNTNKNTHLLTAQKNKKNKGHTKETTFRKMQVWRKIWQENGPKAEKDKTERTRLGRRTKEEI